MSKALKTTIYVLVALFVIGFIRTMADGGFRSAKSAPSGTIPMVTNNSYDNSVIQVESYLKQHLKDPDSYQSIEWDHVKEISDKITSENGGYKYSVLHKYRAKNSFGGYNIETDLFKFDKDGNVISMEKIE